MRLPLQINSAGISAQEQTVRVADRLFEDSIHDTQRSIFLITYQPRSNCKMIYIRSVINLDRKGD